MLFFLCTVGSLKAQTELHKNDLSDVNFNDTALIHSKALTNCIVDYLYQQSCCNEAKFDSLSMLAAGNILKNAKVNMRMYEYILEFMLNGYTTMGKSQVVDYLLSYPQLFEGEISMEEGLRLDSITEPYQKVKVGAKAPDFNGLSIEGKPYRLYDSNAEWILLVFWSTDCEYCHDFLVQIRKHLNLKADYELVTFALAENSEEVSASVKKMRLLGYHFFDDLRWEGKSFLDYHVTSTPTVFLLDADKTIVCKPYDWNELNEWLNQNR